jgi:hypothetical protein
MRLRRESPSLATLIRSDAAPNALPTLPGTRPRSIHGPAAGARVPQASTCPASARKSEKADRAPASTSATSAATAAATRSSKLQRAVGRRQRPSPHPELTPEARNIRPAVLPHALIGQPPDKPKATLQKPNEASRSFRNGTRAALSQTRAAVVAGYPADLRGPLFPAPSAPVWSSAVPTRLRGASPSGTLTAAVTIRTARIGSRKRA